MWQLNLPDLEIDWKKLTDVLTYDPQQPMIFSSGLFLWLFLGFSLIYLLLQRKTTARLLFVSLFSYYFYYKSSGFYFFLLGIVTVSDFLLARWMYRTETSWKRKLIVCCSLCINLGLLCYFKYTNFFYEMLAPLWHGTYHPLDIFLPVGISFFTFQSLSYTIDVYRKDLKPLSNLLDYVFYVSFFPQLVAGPIVRARDFIPQIRQPLYVSPEMFGQGVFFIVSGLFKKAVISDYISVNFVERIFDNPGLYSGLENLFGVYGYALQIYCDFSGYSDMAIGIALLLGFRFPINFNSPYKADSVTDFWHRWHISLSTWLRDYLYISLGGNRKGKIRTYLNLFLTMLLGGLWHGASWNFIVWGGLHGVALAVHKYVRSLLGRAKNYRSTGWKRFFAVVLTFHFVCFCWIFFRNTTFEGSATMIRQIFTAFHPELAGQLFTGYWKVFLLMGVGYLLHACPDRWQEACSRGMIRLPLVGQALVLILLVYLVMQVKSSDIQPFIYFQF
ncbi:MBOAT family protein [Phocaeicola barnesiae]|jgi:alginate O-acetyltransferase complex protein AlgI|uniref:MBOAT family O-acyltransferase n=1 Tax=Phocaeicola barnesiae TaxID=376804 RepID=UPI001F47B2E0|nr:MBOAT family protein [Phocaeicola barnesiae]MBS6467742.1 MBOAT family protein [Bacteroides sp.]MCF2574677.1 MBOAT family protein [Phocaeicola barnesiae]MCF2598247.1 MBOAT family protein [Phocaeicola barnesiae]MDM8233410.1 MBOAT family protein [Phocaeicola barnesiae]MDM8240432.1 MBOAT family protein [Phocaeicola barnesiae]